jgi:hypothetical protein
MCKRLLANTVVEDYAIELLDGAPAAGPAGAGGAGTEEN